VTGPDPWEHDHLGETMTVHLKTTSETSVRMCDSYSEVDIPELNGEVFCIFCDSTKQVCSYGRLVSDTEPNPVILKYTGLFHSFHLFYMNDIHYQCVFSESYRLSIDDCRGKQELLMNIRMKTYFPEETWMADGSEVVDDGGDDGGHEHEDDEGEHEH
jgi:hypothetical protein